MTCEMTWVIRVLWWYMHCEVAYSPLSVCFPYFWHLTHAGNATKLLHADLCDASCPILQCHVLACALNTQQWRDWCTGSLKLAVTQCAIALCVYFTRNIFHLQAVGQACLLVWSVQYVDMMHTLVASCAQHFASPCNSWPITWLAHVVVEQSSLH